MASPFDALTSSAPRGASSRTKWSSKIGKKSLGRKLRNLSKSSRGSSGAFAALDSSPGDKRAVRNRQLKKEASMPTFAALGVSSHSAAHEGFTRHTRRSENTITHARAQSSSLTALTSPLTTDMMSAKHSKSPNGEELQNNGGRPGTFPMNSLPRPHSYASPLTADMAEIQLTNSDSSVTGVPTPTYPVAHTHAYASEQDFPSNEQCSGNFSKNFRYHTQSFSYIPVTSPLKPDVMSIRQLESIDRVRALAVCMDDFPSGVQRSVVTAQNSSTCTSSDSVPSSQQKAHATSAKRSKTDGDSLPTSAASVALSCQAPYEGANMQLTTRRANNSTMHAFPSPEKDTMSIKQPTKNDISSVDAGFADVFPSDKQQSEVSTLKSATNMSYFASLTSEEMQQASVASVVELRRAEDPMHMHALESAIVPTHNREDSLSNNLSDDHTSGTYHSLNCVSGVAVLPFESDTMPTGELAQDDDSVPAIPGSDVDFPVDEILYEVTSRRPSTSMSSLASLTSQGSDFMLTDELFLSSDSTSAVDIAETPCDKHAAEKNERGDSSDTKHAENAEGRSITDSIPFTGLHVSLPFEADTAVAKREESALSTPSLASSGDEYSYFEETPSTSDTCAESFTMLASQLETDYSTSSKRREMAELENALALCAANYPKDELRSEKLVQNFKISMDRSATESSLKKDTTMSMPALPRSASDLVAEKRKSKVKAKNFFQKSTNPFNALTSRDYTDTTWFKSFEKKEGDLSRTLLKHVGGLAAGGIQTSTSQLDMDSTVPVNTLDGNGEKSALTRSSHDLSQVESSRDLHGTTPSSQLARQSSISVKSREKKGMAPFLAKSFSDLRSGKRKSKNPFAAMTSQPYIVTTKQVEQKDFTPSLIRTASAIPSREHNSKVTRSNSSQRSLKSLSSFRGSNNSQRSLKSLSSFVGSNNSQRSLKSLSSSISNLKQGITSRSAQQSEKKGFANAFARSTSELLRVKRQASVSSSKTSDKNMDPFNDMWSRLGTKSVTSAERSESKRPVPALGRSASDIPSAKQRFAIAGRTNSRSNLNPFVALTSRDYTDTAWFKPFEKKESNSNGKRLDEDDVSSNFGRLNPFDALTSCLGSEILEVKQPKSKPLVPVAVWNEADVRRARCKA